MELFRILFKISLVTIQSSVNIKKRFLINCKFFLVDLLDINISSIRNQNLRPFMLSQNSRSQRIRVTDGTIFQYNRGKYCHTVRKRYP